MPKTSKRPTDPPGLNVWQFRQQRKWTLGDLIAAIRRATGRTYSKASLSRLEQQNQYSAESIAHVAAGLSVPLFATDDDVLYYDLNEDGQRKVREYIRDLSDRYRR